MTRVVFHIGDRKTGTTSLQRLFIDWLGPAGHAPGLPLLYPVAGRRGNPDRITHVNLAHEICGDARFTPALGGWTDLGAEVAAHPGALTVVSSEGFESADPARMAAAVATHLPPGTRVQMVCYLRSHIDRICASYAQNVKTGQFGGLLDTFAAKSARGRLGQPFRRLESWRQVFGDRLVVRPYRRDRLLNGDVLDDFLLGVLRLDPALVATRPPALVENTTPGAVLLEEIRRLCLAAGLHKAPVPPDLHLERRYLGPLREALMPHLPGDRPVRLSPAAADRLHAVCLADATAIDAAFFPEAPCFVAALEESRVKAHAAAREPAAPLPVLPPVAQALLEDCRARLAAALAAPPH